MRSMIPMRKRLIVAVATLCCFQGSNWTMAVAEGTEENGRRLVPQTSNLARFEGPLAIRSQGFFQQLRLTLTPAASLPSRKGEWRLRETVTWANLWGWREGSYVVDAETLRTAVRLEHAVSDSIGVSLEVPFVWRGGGVMDHFIDEFHGVTGFRTGGRELFPEKELRVEFNQCGRWLELLHEEDEGMDMGDVVLSGQYLVSKGNGKAPVVALGAAAKAPTADSGRLYGTGGVDGGAWITLAEQAGRFNLYLSTGMVHFGKGEIKGLMMRKAQYSALVGAECAIGKRSSLIFQYLYTSGAAPDLYEFSTGSHEIACGFRTASGRWLEMEAGVIENVANLDNGPDFGLYFGMSQRF